MFRPQLLNFLSPSAQEQGPLVPWYSATYTNLSSTNPLGTDAQLGNMWHTDGPNAAAGANAFMVVKVTATTSKGQVLTTSATTTGTVTAAGSTVAAIVTNITTTINEADNFIYFQDTQELRRIVSSTVGANATFTVAVPDLMIASKPNDPNVLSAIPANGSVVIVYRPFNMTPAGATSVPKAVALQDVTSGNLTVVQVMGLGQILGNNTGAALVSGVPGILGAAGIITGTATPQYLSPNIVPLLAYNSATSILVPAQFNFLGNL